MTLATLRLRRAGRFETEPAEVRFWRAVQKTEACWLWLGTRDAKGYGRFIPWRGERAHAHRWA